MYFIYIITSYIFVIISPLVIIYRIAIGKENKVRFQERYAIPTAYRNKGKLIWFHCSSVGELISIIPLLEKLELNKNINQILITTTTLSSSKIFTNFNFKKTVHQFFPIDNNFIVKKFLDHWKPSCLFLCESEIWPNMINAIHRRKIKLILLNARLTNKSFKRWRKLKHFSTNLFRKFDMCFPQNHETSKRLKILGVKNILNLGNLKFSTSKKVERDFLKKKYLVFFRNKKILITAASTHYNEEDFIIKSHLYFKKKFKNIVSIIIPRHVERSREISKELEKLSFKFHLHSSTKKIDPKIDFYIVDTYGETNKFYKISNIVFMGGSLIPHGGQNPLEAAKLGCKIIHGPNVYNFKEIYEKLNKMKISTNFYTYKNGIKIINKELNTRKFSLKNNRIINYGQKILKLTYTELIEFI